MEIKIVKKFITNINEAIVGIMYEGGDLRTIPRPPSNSGGARSTRDVTRSSMMDPVMLQMLTQRGGLSSYSGGSSVNEGVLNVQMKKSATRLPQRGGRTRSRRRRTPGIRGKGFGSFLKKAARFGAKALKSDTGRALVKNLGKRAGTALLNKAMNKASRMGLSDDMREGLQSRLKQGLDVGLDTGLDKISSIAGSGGMTRPESLFAQKILRNIN